MSTPRPVAARILPTGELPTSGQLVQLCKTTRPPKTLLSQVRAIQDSQSTDTRLREYARRVLHVLFQGGCAPAGIRLEAARRLARFYFDQGSCDAGRMVFRLYVSLHRRQRPGVPPPKPPACP
jgi:hypothetical protein